MFGCLTQQRQFDIQSDSILVTSLGIGCKTDFQKACIQGLLCPSHETEVKLLLGGGWKLLEKGG